MNLPAVLYSAGSVLELKVKGGGSTGQRHQVCTQSDGGERGEEEQQIDEWELRHRICDETITGVKMSALRSDTRGASIRRLTSTNHLEMDGQHDGVGQL